VVREAGAKAPESPSGPAIGVVADLRHGRLPLYRLSGPHAYRDPALCFRTEIFTGSVTSESRTGCVPNPDRGVVGRVSGGKDRGRHPRPGAGRGSPGAAAGPASAAAEDHSGEWLTVRRKMA